MAKRLPLTCAPIRLTGFYSPLFVCAPTYVKIAAGNSTDVPSRARNLRSRFGNRRSAYCGCVEMVPTVANGTVRMDSSCVVVGLLWNQFASSRLFVVVNESLTSRFCSSRNVG